MLSSTFVALLAASGLVHGLPTIFRRELPSAASVPGLGALTGALGNVPGLGDLAANLPGAAGAAAGGGRANQGAGARAKGQGGKNRANANKGNGNKNNQNAVSFFLLFC